MRKARPRSIEPWWRLEQSDSERVLHSAPTGLTQRQASARLRRHGPNRLQKAPRPGWLRAIGVRLGNPLILVLLGASAISALTGDAVSFGFVALIVLMSIGLDMLQEHRAGNAVEALQHSVALQVRVWRDGRVVSHPASDVVPGDMIELSAGDLVPADGRIVVANDCFVDQAALTGEAYPVEKRPRDGPGSEADERQAYLPMRSSHQRCAKNSAARGVSVCTVR